MFKSILCVLFAASLFALSGCTNDRPAERGRSRGDLSSLDDNDRGLQSKDLVDSTEQLVRDLLSSPKLNHADQQWKLVVDRIDNQTTDPRFDYNIFIRRLGTLIARDGEGRVALIENKAKFHSVQDREIEKGAPDNFGQGAGAAGNPAGIQPDFALVGVVQEIPNRATRTFRLEFRVTDLRTRVVVWTNDYMVKTDR